MLFRSCKVEVPPEQQSGNFADAFRVVPLSENEWVLDFLAIDGLPISWDQFGEMLMTFEGWNLKLDIFDRTEE